MGRILGICFIIFVLVSASYAADPVVIEYPAGTMIISGCPECPPPVPEGVSPSASHFAWHPQVAKAQGVAACTFCHGADLKGTSRSVAHGPRVFPAKDKVLASATGCYANPYVVRGLSDPFGFGAVICNSTEDKVAIFTEGVVIGCADCHSKVLGVTIR